MNAMVLALCGGYVLGSVPVAYWYCRWRFNENIRERGSGNPGATNVARVFGWSSGGVVFVGDFCKGLAATFLVIHSLDGSVLQAVIAGFGAVLGHIFPVFARFKGGKGVATAAGTMLLLSPQALGFSILTYVGVLFVVKKGSFASLSAALVLIPSAWFFASDQVFYFAAVLVLLIFITHRSNIQKLSRGEEKDLIR
jgi:glycerol-3-phosphate acyltransferase PlsY